MDFFMQYTGLLKAEGTDTIDFFNRMTTNDLSELSRVRHLKTLLLNDKGRIIDLLTIFPKGDKFFVKTSTNNEQRVQDYLNKFIVMDNVTLSKCEGQFVNFVVTGSDKDQALKKVIEYESKLGDVQDCSGQLFYYNDDLAFESSDIICHIDKSHEIRALLSTGHFQTCVDYESMRIGKGRPESPGELNEEINPLECGLRKYISFTKGCYLGQEVIARLDSQGKLPKQMVLIESGEELKSLMPIHDSEGKECGFISSAINSGNKSIALGFIRSIDLNFNSAYRSDIDGKQIAFNIKKII
jgi:folate-binding protein YgfZ